MNSDFIYDLLQKEAVERTGKWQNIRLDGLTVDANQSRNKIFFSLSRLDFEGNYFNGSPPESTQHIMTAFAGGAILCIIRKDTYFADERTLYRFRNRIVVVDNVIRVLQQIAAQILSSHPVPVVGITGSAGKTTTKDMIAHILKGLRANYLVSAGNQNNGIGLPLTLSKLGDSHIDYSAVVLEMGMSCPGGELARLCEIAPPNIAVLLNILPVHLEHFGTIEAIARGKLQILENMKENGIGVINRDDPLIEKFLDPLLSYVSFGCSDRADYSAQSVKLKPFSTEFKLRTPRGNLDARIGVPGLQNVMNASAAVAVCDRLKIDPAFAIERLQSFSASPHRGSIHRCANEVLLIDDTYNSNPVALILAIESASMIANATRRLIIIAGEMLELGATEAELHFEAGRNTGLFMPSIVIGIGGLMRHFLDGVAERCSASIVLFDNINDIVNFVDSILTRGDVILVKGSRRNHLEQVISALQENIGRS